MIPLNNNLLRLKRSGIRKTVMLTGDNEAIGKAVAAELGLDDCYAELLPGGKVDVLEKLDAEKIAEGIRFVKEMVDHVENL